MTDLPSSQHNLISNILFSNDDGAVNLVTRDNSPQGLVILHIALPQVTATHVLSVIAVVFVILSFLPHSY